MTTGSLGTTTMVGDLGGLVAHIQKLRIFLLSFSCFCWYKPLKTLNLMGLVEFIRFSYLKWLD